MAKSSSSKKTPFADRWTAQSNTNQQQSKCRNDRKRRSTNRHQEDSSDLPQRFSYKSVRILKSPIDARRYEAVRFENGLQAVIISTYYCENDIDDSKPLEPTTCNFQEVYEFNKRILQMYKQVGPDRDEMSLLDLVTSFPHEDKVDKVGDVNLESECIWDPPHKAYKKACPTESLPDLFGISITVAVGCLHDPLKVSGLAHLLEHSLFLRTKKYGDPWTEISNNSYLANAGTEMEQTFYYANMRTKAEFIKILDIFSDMILRATLSDEDVRREVHAVDTENTIKLSRDFLRIGALFQRSCCHKNHHMAKFGMGDISSLGRPDIGRILRDHYDRYYKANYITLCLQGPLPVEEFIQLAAEHFHELEYSEKPSAFEEVAPEGFPFDMKLFAQSYRVFPFKSIQWMIFSWVLPPQSWLNHDTKPLEYVAGLFNDKGTGGIDHYLRHKGWITCSSTSYTSESLDQDAIFISNSLYAGLHYGLELTDQGLYHESQVIQAVFAYIAMLRKEGPRRRIFDELRTVKANVYHYRTWSEKSVIDIGFSSNRHRNPKLILTAADLITTYNPEVISNVLDGLVPRRTNLLIASKKFERFVTHIDPTSLVSYTSAPMSESFLNQLENVRPYVDFQLPRPNPYVSDKLCKLVPTRIGGMTIESNLAYLRNCGKAGFAVEAGSGQRGVPEYSHYAVSFSSSLCRSSTNTTVMVCLWRRILQRKMEVRIWEALKADAAFDIFDGESGILIYLSGPASWLPTVWLELLDEFINFDRYLSEGEFVGFKEVYMKVFSNANIKYDTLGLAEDLYLYMTTSQYLLMSTMETYLRYNITYEEFLKFTKHFKSRMWIFAQINGSVTYEQLDTLASSITGLDYEALPVGEMCLNRTYVIPGGDRCLRVKAMSKACITSTVWNHYQFGQLCYEDEILLGVLGKHLSNFLFQRLRTQEQLSYYVKVEADTSFGISGISVVVIAQSDRFKPGYVDERIDHAFISFYNVHLQSTANIQKLFNCSFVEFLECDDELLAESPEDFAEKVRKLYTSFLPYKPETYQGVPSYHKLSIQVQGNIRYDTSVPAEPVDLERKRSLYEKPSNLVNSVEGIQHVQGKIVLDLPEDIRHENAYFVTDLARFRHGLKMYPSKVISNYPDVIE